MTFTPISTKLLLLPTACCCWFKFNFTYLEYTVKPCYLEPLKCRHLVSTDILLCHYNSWNWDTLLFHKGDRCFSPTSFCTVQILFLIMWTCTHMPLKQHCLFTALNSTSEHYNSTGMYSSRTHGTKVHSAQNMSMHCHAYWKYRSEIQAPPCSRDSRSPYGVHIRGAALYLDWLSSGLYNKQWRWYYKHL